MLKRYNFCPGNMGSYDILFGRVPRYVPCPDTKQGETLAVSPDEKDGGYLLVWLNKGGSGGGAFRFDSEMNSPCSGYLMEKMGVNLAGDANALLAFLRTQGINVRINSAYWDDDGNYIPSPRQPDPENVHRL